ncbi:phage tail tape measure protein [Paracoccus sp. (in: a-proteobacteria)]|uniref:phage tail tape measure protein n=1 Tax=Paracoccus sp. TaxID=267 RepID=UPI00289BFEC1|nr:phage tail tape measure protein [Paracoccus sp. (in: a-proteobacteria)]
MANKDGLDHLADGLGAGLGDGLDQGGKMTAAFEAELARLRQSMIYTSREVGTLSAGIGGGLRRAFEGLAFDGMRLSDALKGVAQSIAHSAFAVAMRPIEQALSGAITQGIGSLAAGALPFANGGAFVSGRVTPFARGGVVTQPTTFPMRGGLGLMGEAGPEAIMPLQRGADGRLGVASNGGGQGRAMNVTINVSTPDVAGFQRSQSQIAAQMGRLLARGDRNG